MKRGEAIQPYEPIRQGNTTGIYVNFCRKKAKGRTEKKSGGRINRGGGTGGCDQKHPHSRGKRRCQKGKEEKGRKVGQVHRY